jgi:hypothetical protein
MYRPASMVRGRCSSAVSLSEMTPASLSKPSVRANDPYSILGRAAFGRGQLLWVQSSCAQPPEVLENNCNGLQLMLDRSAAHCALACLGIVRACAQASRRQEGQR